MSDSLKKKSDDLKKYFLTLPPGEERYNAIMALGRALPPYPTELKTPDKIVKGCQSVLYLNARFIDGKVFFEISSEALISAGLGALLIQVYNGESPETILKHPPTFLQEIGLGSTLSPSRSNGLSQIHLKMKQLALAFLLNS